MINIDKILFLKHIVIFPNLGEIIYSFKVINDKIFGNNIMEQSQLEQIKELISQTNIEIIKCYKDLFFFLFYISSPGFFIVICLIIIQIISIIVFIRKDLYLIKKYIFTITNQYILYLTIQKNGNAIGGNNIVPNLYENKVIKYMEPPKKRSVQTSKKEINDDAVYKKKKKRKTTSNKKKKISFNL